MPESRFEILEVRGGRWVVRWDAGAGVDAGVAGRGVVEAGASPLPAPDAAARVRQVHGDAVATVDRPGVHGEADALVTTAVGVPLVIRVADCVPVVLVAPTGVALAHAGWRGSAAGVAARTLERLLAATGETPARVRAWIGPAIGSCCYEVGDEVADAFPAAHRRRVAGRARLDLAAVNRDQLIGAGVPAASVVVSGYCTRCHQHLFHSHRGSGGKPGRLDAFVVRMPTPAAGDAGHPFSVRS